MQHTLNEFEAAMSALIEQGNVDAALSAIRAMVDAVIADPAATGSVLRSARLDQLCTRLGRLTLNYLQQESLLPPPAPAPAEVIVVATELHHVGGHSRVVEDIIRARPDAHHLILLTNFLDCRYTMDLSRYAALGVEVRMAPAGNGADKLLWLQQQLSAHRDAQVLLFNHHADAAAVAAVQDGLNRETVFCHHADHHLCLGAALAHVRHVDFFEAFCRDCTAAGLPAELWSLGVADIGQRPQDAASFCRDGILLSCTSAHEAKLLAPYPFHYWDVLPLILKATGGKHLHIGHLPADVMQAIEAALAAHGIERSRFASINWVENLGATLIEQGVDLYIGSFPLGGGRATLEAMSAGIPIMTHCHSLFPMLGAAGQGPADTPNWATVEDLQRQLAGMTPQSLAALSASVRAHSQNMHSPAAFTQALLAQEKTHTQPAARAIQGDQLASYLMRSALRQENFAMVFELIDAQATTATPPPVEDAPALLARGTALLEAGQLEAANEALMQALEKNPGDANTLFELGRLAIAAQMPEDAFGILAAAVEADAAMLQRLLTLGEDLVRQGNTGDGQIVLNFLREMMAQRRPSGTPEDGLARIRGLSDPDWAALLAQSHKNPDYHGFQMPGFPSEEFQINTMGCANENAMHEAFLFYRAVLPFIGRMRDLQSRTLLDFGTGWGRFARTFVKRFEPHNIWGIDVDPVMIKTCQDNFSFGNFQVCPAFPPSQFEANSFDLITAYSVFSHLSQDAANQWMHEFARILRPGGMVAFTTQGRSFIAQCAYFRQQSVLHDEWHKQLAKAFVDEARCYADYDAGKHLFAPTGGGEARPSDFYGEAMIPAGFMIREWGDIFDLLTFVDDRSIMPQAFAVLRKK